MGKCKNVKIIGFFYIFLDILHKIKGNLGKEHVKKGFYPSRAKIGTIFPTIPEKMTVFLVLSLLFHKFLPKIWLSHRNETYIFEISDNRAIH